MRRQPRSPRPAAVSTEEQGAATADDPSEHYKAGGWRKRPLRTRRLLLALAALSALSTAANRLAGRTSVLPIDHTSMPVTDGWHPRLRSDRFPSVSERVRLYMSDDWYDTGWTGTEGGADDGAPRGGGGGSRIRPVRYARAGGGRLVLLPDLGSSGGTLNGTSVTLDGEVRPDRPFSMDPAVVTDCARPPFQILRDGSRVTLPTDSDSRLDRKMMIYCEDALELVVMRREMGGGDGATESGPVLMQLGDQELLVDQFKPLGTPVPVLHKWRYVRRSGGDVGGRRPRAFQPIVWPLEYARHFEEPMPEVQRDDIPWEDKRDVAVWRGELTGIEEHLIPGMDRETCFGADRCRLCLSLAGSQLADVGIAATGVTNGDFRVGGVLLSKGRMSIGQLLEHKMLISVEGNDVATNLKWSLLSRSVVLMAPPTKMCWAMEELLEPWVHYIPLHPDYSDVEEKVRWVRQHDVEARKVAERATLFMSDMLYHPDAAKDDRRVMEEILMRYDDLLAPVDSGKHR